jgi:hypothetical protein
MQTCLKAWGGRLDVERLKVYDTVSVLLGPDLSFRFLSALALLAKWTSRFSSLANQVDVKES